MKSLRRTPSASMVVAIAALVVALSGTAVAATSLIAGDKLIKKNSLSGNRIRNHTISGKQVNMNQLGKVPSAANADHASLAQSAANAVNAQTAQNANNAGNAATLGGQAPSAFAAASNVTRTGIVGANVGQSVTLATFGPFTLTLKCTSGTGSTVESQVLASSSQAGSEDGGTTLPNSNPVADSGTPSSSFSSQGAFLTDFLAPGSAYFGQVMAAVNSPASASPCLAFALVGKS